MMTDVPTHPPPSTRVEPPSTTRTEIPMPPPPLPVAETPPLDLSGYDSRSDIGLALEAVDEGRPYLPDDFGPIPDNILVSTITFHTVDGETPFTRRGLLSRLDLGDKWIQVDDTLAINTEPGAYWVAISQTDDQ